MTEYRFPPWWLVRVWRGAWTFAADTAYAYPAAILPCAPGRIVQVYYLDEEPARVVPALKARKAELEAGAGLGALTKRELFAGPFEVIRPWEWDWLEPKGTEKSK